MGIGLPPPAGMTPGESPAEAKLDRLGRSVQHLLQVLDDLASLRCRLRRAVRDAGIDTTTEGFPNAPVFGHP